MGRRHWGAIIAVGVTFFAFSGQAEEKAKNEQGEANQQESPSQTLPIPLPVHIVEDQAAADARERREEEARNREIEDLAAQQGMDISTRAMNEATQDMRKYALYSTILVGVGTALLFWTLQLTRLAVSETTRVGEAQVKAYVSAIGATIEVADENGFDFPEDEPKIVLHIHNSGATPAVNVSYFCTPRLGKISEKSILEPIGVAECENFIPNIAAGKTGKIDVVAVGMRGLMRDFRKAEIMGQTPAMFIQGFIFYDDVFGKTHRSQFCFIFSDPDQRGELHPIQASTPQFEKIADRDEYVKKAG